jgi:hypothetical protein
MGSKIRQNILPKIFDHETSQTRMLSVVDYEKGRLNIAVLEPKEQEEGHKGVHDLNAVHPLDKMDLHRQTREMLNRDIMIATLGIKKLQAINENIREQLKNEKLANKTKQIRVEELEQWVMDLGDNPQDVAYVQALMKTKDTKIEALKKRLKIPGLEHVQTLELQVI